MYTSSGNVQFSYFVTFKSRLLHDYIEVHIFIFVFVIKETVIASYSDDEKLLPGARKRVEDFSESE